MGYGEALTHVRDALASAGLNAVLDPADLGELPGLWVEPDRMVPAFLDGGFEATVVVLGVVGDTGTVEALDALTEMVSMVQARTTLAVEEVEFTRAALENHSPDPLPAIRFRTTLQVTPENPPAPAGGEN
jgi:hypothetical protein